MQKKKTRLFTICRTRSVNLNSNIWFCHCQPMSCDHVSGVPDFKFWILSFITISRSTYLMCKTMVKDYQWRPTVLWGYRQSQTVLYKLNLLSYCWKSTKTSTMAKWPAQRHPYQWFLLYLSKSESHQVLSRLMSQPIQTWTRLVGVLPPVKLTCCGWPMLVWPVPGA